MSSAPTINTTSGAATGATITFGGNLNGATAITLQAGTAGNIAFTGIVGGSAPPTNLIFTSAHQIQIGNNITVSGANPLSFPDPVLLTGASAITSNNANISFSTTLDGAQALTIIGGGGTTMFTGAVGGITPLASLSATTAIITQSSTAQTTGAISYTGSTAINLYGNQTTSGGNIGWTGPVSLDAAITVDTTDGGVTTTGANISASATINGAYNLTLDAGTGGTITLSGAVGNSAALEMIAISDANNVTASGVITAASLTQSAGSGLSTFSGGMTLSADLDLTGNAFTTGGLISAQNLNMNNLGTWALSNGAVIELTGALTQEEIGPVFLGSSITTNGGNVQFLAVQSQ